MALKQLKMMRSILRAQIKEPKQDKFTDLELNAYINLGQFDVCKRLLKINKAWFSKRQQVSRVVGGGEYDTATLPSDCHQPEAITTVNGIPIQLLPLSGAGLTISNSMHTPSSNNPYGMQVGNTLYLWGGSGAIYVYYYQEPVELVNDADETIISVRFVDMILSFAVWKCAEKAGLNVAQKEKEYDEMFREVEERLRRDIEVKTPGSDKG